MIYHRWRTAVSALAWLPAAVLIFVQAGSGMRDMPQMAFFLIFLQERLGLATGVISAVVAGSQLASMAAGLLGGALVARLGSKRVLLAGLALSALASLAFQAPWFWLVSLLWFLGGVGMALITVGNASYLTQIGGRGGLGMLAAFYALSMTIGGALGNPAAGLLIERSGFVIFSWSVIALSALIILVVGLAMPSFNSGAAAAAPSPDFWAGIRAALRRPNMPLLVGMRSLPTIYYGMLTVLIPLLINTLSGSKVVVAAYGTTTLVVASAAQLLAGRAADRWGARVPAAAAYSVLIISGAGLALSGGALWGLFAFGVLGNAAAWSLSTLMYVWVNDGVPRAAHPAAFGLLHAVWSLSMITGSMLGGWFAAAHPGPVFLAGGLLNSAAIFFLFRYYRPGRLPLEASA
jgi:MFS family permease